MSEYIVYLSLSFHLVCGDLMCTCVHGYHTVDKNVLQSLPVLVVLQWPELPSSPNILCAAVPRPWAIHILLIAHNCLVDVYFLISSNITGGLIKYTWGEKNIWVERPERKLKGMEWRKTKGEDKRWGRCTVDKTEEEMQRWKNCPFPLIMADCVTDCQNESVWKRWHELNSVPTVALLNCLCKKWPFLTWIILVVKMWNYLCIFKKGVLPNTWTWFG